MYLLSSLISIKIRSLLHPRVRSTSASLKWRRFPQTPSAKNTVASASSWKSCNGVRPGKGHRHPGDDGDSLFPYPYPHLLSNPILVEIRCSAGSCFKLWLVGFCQLLVSITALHRPKAVHLCLSRCDTV